MTLVYIHFPVHEHRLTPAEKKHNGFGTSTRVLYTPGELTEYLSSLPSFLYIAARIK